MAVHHSDFRISTGSGGEKCIPCASLLFELRYLERIEDRDCEYSIIIYTIETQLIDTISIPIKGR